VADPKNELLAVYVWVRGVRRHWKLPAENENA